MNKNSTGKDLNFLRLNDYLLSILFEDTEILAIDKPYGVNSHTNDAKSSATDFNQDDLSDGLIEIYEKQLQKKLYIVHRLDQTTTGVIVFAKSQEAAKKYAEFFFSRQVKKTYWFITASKVAKENFIIDQMILHKAKELEAKTEFNFIKKTTLFSLWQASPLTGRNHQIRIHAQAAGVPIIGDEKYGGFAFPFLCLHNHKIEFPNGIIILSSAPTYFENLDILENQILSKILFETDRRLRLFSRANWKNQCFRLVHSKNSLSKNTDTKRGAKDRSKDFGFTIDQFGKVLVLSYYNEDWLESDYKTFLYFATYMKKAILVRLMHNRGKDPLSKSQFIIYPKPNSASTSTAIETSWIANENHIKYELRSDSGQSFGLFLDQRLQRSWVLNNSSNKVVLNLFSYTCGFSLAAALGDATQITSVDTSKNSLNRGKKNFELNNLSAEAHKFLARDSLEFLDFCLKKNIKYDLIICDPPSFSRGEKGVFKIEQSLETLLQKCLSCLNPNGALLFSTNFENFYIDDIRKSILKVKALLNLNHLQINSIQSALDFELAGTKSILKSFLIKI